MKRKDVKRLFRQHPEFKTWLMEDSSRAKEVRKNPDKAEELFRRWNERNRQRQRLDFNSLSQKTKRASEMLNGVQSIMDMMADYTKKL
ncbi:hypothetical protein ACAF76_010370 [Brevibacillus sp. TJ4]|uniref:hypothetical protein n=1 Tax=Brevibacillus sp. TJ4 TaxID=3234853 RepID=UPI003BA1E4C1